MGLKTDLINAKKEGLLASGVSAESLINAGNVGSPMEIQAKAEAEAIANFITNVKFHISKLNAPVVIEELKTPDLPVNISIETLFAEYKPLLDALKKIGSVVPGFDSLIDKVENQIKEAIEVVAEGGAKLPFNIGKQAGGLSAKAYVNIGEDPDSVDNFDVTDEQGQKDFTVVQVKKEDIEDLLK